MSLQKHGVQVFGGHGFIVEHGMEQIVRDARISTLYRGERPKSVSRSAGT